MNKRIIKYFLYQNDKKVYDYGMSLQLIKTLDELSINIYDIKKYIYDILVPQWNETEYIVLIRSYKIEYNVRISIFCNKYIMYRMDYNDDKGRYSLTYNNTIELLDAIQQNNIDI